MCSARTPTTLSCYKNVFNNIPSGGGVILCNNGTVEKRTDIYLSFIKLNFDEKFQVMNDIKF